MLGIGAMQMPGFGRMARALGLGVGLVLAALAAAPASATDRATEALGCAGDYLTLRHDPRAVVQLKALDDRLAALAEIHGSEPEATIEPGSYIGELTGEILRDTVRYCEGYFAGLPGFEAPFSYSFLSYEAIEDQADYAAACAVFYYAAARLGAEADPVLENAHTIFAQNRYLQLIEAFGLDQNEIVGMALSGTGPAAGMMIDDMLLDGRAGDALSILRDCDGLYGFAPAHLAQTATAAPPATDDPALTRDEALYCAAHYNVLALSSMSGEFENLSGEFANIDMLDVSLRIQALEDGYAIDEMEVAEVSVDLQFGPFAVLGPEAIRTSGLRFVAEVLAITLESCDKKFGFTPALMLTPLAPPAPDHLACIASYWALGVLEPGAQSATTPRVQYSAQVLAAVDPAMTMEAIRAEVMPLVEATVAAIRITPENFGALVAEAQACDAGYGHGSGGQ